MAPFKLTKQHIKTAFAPLCETSNPTIRSRFFKETCIPDITWTVCAPSSSLHGTRNSITSHCAATFNRLLPKLTAPIKFTIRRIILDAEPEADGWWASIETCGEAETKLGGRYDNEYVWLTRWDAEGRLVEVRSYFDTLMAEGLLNLVVPVGEGEELRLHDQNGDEMNVMKG